MKKCSRCKKLKNKSEFSGDNARKDGLNCYCRDCLKIIQKSYRASDLDKYKLCNKRSNLKKYNITLDDFEALLDEQDGVCAIVGCGSQDRLSIDHDHTCCSGKYSCGKCIRGLLCFRCNTALGCIQDNKEILLDMINYLGSGFKCRM